MPYGMARRGHALTLISLPSACHYLHTLYDLLRPIVPYLGQRRLLIVPHRSLHYVPFHALYDGAQYVIEQREVCLAPSASVLQYCLAQPDQPTRRAVLCGVPDAQTPRVRDEVQAIAPLFPQSELLLDDEVTLGTLRERAAHADILHLACHGQFRPDNPLFSSLQLADGWLTVRDAYSFELACKLVTLSACETGVSAIAPGDELIGLACGEAALDLANALVHFDLRAQQGRRTAEQAEAAKAALIDGYQPDIATCQRIAVYDAAVRLRLLCVYTFRPQWRTTVAPLLDRGGVLIGT